MFDIESIRARLTAIGFERGNPVHDALTAVALVLGDSNLDDEQLTTVLDLMSSEGREAVNKAESHGDDAWRDFDYGNVRIGDFVRVKKDAFDSPIGSKHNGRVGRLVHMSNRVCTVSYLGIPTERQVKHNMNKLQSLVHSVG